MNYHTVKLILEIDQLRAIEEACILKQALKLNLKYDQVFSAVIGDGNLENALIVPLTSSQMAALLACKSAGLQLNLVLHGGQVSELSRINFGKEIEITQTYLLIRSPQHCCYRQSLFYLSMPEWRYSS